MEKAKVKGFKKIEPYTIDLDEVLYYYFNDFNAIPNYLCFYFKGGKTYLQITWKGDDESRTNQAKKYSDELATIFLGKTEAEEKLFE